MEIQGFFGEKIYWAPKDRVSCTPLILLMNTYLNYEQGMNFLTSLVFCKNEKCGETTDVQIITKTTKIIENFCSNCIESIQSKDAVSVAKTVPGE